MCEEKIAISIDGDEWNKYEDKGGYTYICKMTFFALFLRKSIMKLPLLSFAVYFLENEARQDFTYFFLSFYIIVPKIPGVRLVSEFSSLYSDIQ